MPIVLIADACKPSLVMSSEVFKDKIAGATILVATSGKQCLAMLGESNPDICVVDFDLPDTDGITLISAMRKTYNGPILLTAFPEKVIEDAIANDLFAWGDAGGWVPKPVKFDILSERIDKFLLDKHRIGRRFDVAIETLIIGKGAGRGKRAPKVKGKIVNLSLGGACLELDSPLKVDSGEEMTVSLNFPQDSDDGQADVSVAPHQSKVSTKGGKAKAKSRAALDEEQDQDGNGSGARLRCTIAWVDRKCTKAGIKFSRLTDIQRKGIEDLLRATISE
jgi:CheY-like chemotaxis protein